MKTKPSVRGWGQEGVDMAARLLGYRTCPYCRYLLAVKILSLWLQVPDGAEMQDYLKEKTGQGTVPNVFINGKHLGKLS